MTVKVEHSRNKVKFPEFNLIDYDRSLRDNLFFYNSEIDDNKQKKEWVLSYWKDEKKPVDAIKNLSDGFFVTAGAVAHMIKYRKIDLDDEHSKYLDKKYKELMALVRTTIPESETKIVVEVSKEAKAEAELRSHIGEFEYGIDMFFQGKEFDAQKYLIRNNVKSNMMKDIANALKPTLKEVKQAILGKDEQLVESYSHLTKRKLNKFSDYIQSLISSCEVASAISKASRKPRKRKVKAPTELVKAVKYLAYDESSKLKSEHPSKIVNSSEVWVYNAKNRRLFKYVPLPGLQLSVKGSTIININQEKSGGKIVRKPESQLTGIQNMTSRPLSKLFSDIRGTVSRATGRLSEDILIVKYFS